MAGGRISGDQPLVLLPAVTITTAVTGLTGAVFVPRQGLSFLVVQGVFVYGSGGTTAKAWVQTSLDGGTTWIDIASLAFLLASATKVSALALAIALAAAATPPDGSLADNTIVNGLLRERARGNYTT